MTITLWLTARPLFLIKLSEEPAFPFSSWAMVVFTLALLHVMFGRITAVDGRGTFRNLAPQSAGEEMWIVIGQLENPNCRFRTAAARVALVLEEVSSDVPMDAIDLFHLIDVGLNQTSTGRPLNEDVNTLWTERTSFLENLKNPEDMMNEHEAASFMGWWDEKRGRSRSREKAPDDDTRRRRTSAATTATRPWRTGRIQHAPHQQGAAQHLREPCPRGTSPRLP